MKIRLAILDTDNSCLDRITAAFTARFADRLEVCSFTNEETVLNHLNTSRIDVLLAGEEFEIDRKRIPARCSFAYFVESADVKLIRGEKAISKFQRADLLYKEILNLYAENTSTSVNFSLSDSSSEMVAFASAGGGAGSSTAAAAFAGYASRQGRKTLYLNLEQFGCSDTFFTAEGQFDFSDVLYALESRKTNLSLKLEGAVKQDAGGVYFYSSPKNALDITELTKEDLLRLLQELSLAGSYDLIVLDIDFRLNAKTLGTLQSADKIVFVCDGTDISNAKLQRAYAAMQTLEEQRDISIMGRAYVLYNKFSNKNGRVLENVEMKRLGGVPKFEHANTREVMRQLMSMQVFQGLLEGRRGERT